MTCGSNISGLWHHDTALPEAWLAKARELKRAGDRLMELYALDWTTPWAEERSFFGIALMLYGFALENALKGNMIEQDPSIADAVKQRLVWPPGVGGHELSAQGRFIGMNWDQDPDTLRYVDCLEEQLTWQGRYPTTLRARDYI